MSATLRAQPGNRGGAQTTTITEDGKTTQISTDQHGVVTIRENGEVKTVIDPGAIARQAAEGATAAVAHDFQGPPPGFRDGEIPESVMKLIAFVLSIVALVIIGYPISRAFARRLDRKAAGTAPDGDVVHRLDRIEQAIETMAEEVERVSEAQRYSARLLTERLPDTPARSLAGADQIMR